MTSELGLKRLSDIRYRVFLAFVWRYRRDVESVGARLGPLFSVSSRPIVVLTAVHM